MSEKQHRRARAAAGRASRAIAVERAMQTPDFDERMNQMIDHLGDRVQSRHEVRDIVHAVLEEMAVPHQGVAITLSWDPASRKLNLWARPKARRICAAPRLRAVGASELP